MIRLNQRKESGSGETLIVMLVMAVLAYLVMQGGGGILPIPGITTGPLNVLIVEETAERGSLPEDQQDMLPPSGELRTYLDTKCAKGPDGKSPEWRIWDHEIDASYAPESWKKALAQPRESLPWVHISNGKSVYSGKLPANEAEFLSLLKKYGG